LYLIHLDPNYEVEIYEHVDDIDYFAAVLPMQLEDTNDQVVEEE